LKQHYLKVMKRYKINTSKILKKGRKGPKLVEWVPLPGSRSNRFVTRELGASTKVPTTESTLRQDTDGQSNDGAVPLLPDTSLMDVDESHETLWVDEPVEPGKNRVSLPAHPSLTIFYLSQSQGTYIDEFIPMIGPYLRCLLNSEGVPATTACQSCMSAPFEWRCSDCFPTLVLCKECCRKSHQKLPFHRVQKWTGEFFMPSWLREVGVCLRFGHFGDLCPSQSVRHLRHQAFHTLGLIIKNTAKDGL
jgi:hypothetical protein